MFKYILGAAVIVVSAVIAVAQPLPSVNWGTPVISSTVGVINVADYHGSLSAAYAAATARGGGRVFVPPGTYPQTTYLTVSSKTSTECAQGALITFTNSGWIGPNLPSEFTTNAKIGIINTNHEASSKLDSDINFEGCTFQALGSFATDGNFHHINIRQAKHVRVDHNGFIGGGDGTAMLASDDTVVTRNWMTGAYNACYDHWEAPGNAVIDDNYCQVLSGYGILFTGTNTNITTAQTANGGSAKGNRIVLSSASAGLGIWAQGIGTAGSGANGFTITGNYIVGDGTATNFDCVRVSGTSKGNQVIGNTCDGGGAANGQAIQVISDSGGTPSDTVVLGNTLSNMTVSGGNIAPIQDNGTRSIIADNRIHAITAPYIVWETGTSAIISNNSGETGTSGRYLSSAATTPLIIDTDPAAGSVTITAGTKTLALIPGGALSIGSTSVTTPALTFAANQTAYPVSGFGGSLGFNFWSGQQAVDIFNNSVGALQSFNFWQKTGTSAATLIAAITPKGVISQSIAAASLPTCNSTGDVSGAILHITSSNTQTFGASITGAGAFNVLGWCNNSSWTVIGQ